VTLDHLSPDCPGTWQRRWTGAKTAHWRCDGCAAVYDDTPDVAAAVERCIGRLVRRLTQVA
jgi:hypothetical protein